MSATQPSSRLHIYGDGDPEGVRQRAAQEMIDTGKACRKFIDAGKDYMSGREQVGHRSSREWLHRLQHLARPLCLPAH